MAVQTLSCEGFVSLQLNPALCAKGPSLFQTCLCPCAPSILHFCSSFMETDNLFDSTFFFPRICLSSSHLSFLCWAGQFISIQLLSPNLHTQNYHLEKHLLLLAYRQKRDLLREDLLPLSLSLCPSPHTCTYKQYNIL